MVSLEYLSVRSSHLSDVWSCSGTIEKIRRAIGVNISNPLVVNAREESKLKKAIERFVTENSDECPKKDKAAAGIRYCHMFKWQMWQHFLTDNPDNLSCSIATFHRLWPKNVKRPKLADSER